MSTVRWGFLGAGYIATQALAPAVHAASGAVLQAVGARDEARARALEPAGRTHTDYAALCADPDIDAVYIALPGDAHLPWTLAALAAGKHVLCEKPLGANVDEVQQMVAAAAAADRLLVEAAWNRWHPRTQRIIELAAVAPTTEPMQVDATFAFGGVAEGNFRLDPALGGGALYDIGCYCIAASAAILSTPAAALDVVSVDARIGPTGVDLTTVAALKGPRGTARITASIDSPEHQELRVAAGAWGVELLSPAFSSWREPSALRIHEADRSWDESFASIDAYQAMVEAVSRRIAGDDSAWVLPLAETLTTAATIDRIRSDSKGIPA